ncbi:regulator of chromosome condensation 1/beta-lactamase-inhibitor protein II [Zychaea mexicana]|uniref:regulator of chromosome condensation 1/beta-lactamase-inhibitor protein II n=1 Tax=Zychaea mexicana TaxID=64656 RepID=UPI0022FDD928|nr:regulator of chromosome condensation 1/beta-lactamase-inhibitor protein II [Zychaea mexicana]KAI9482581.1 regulator of chromosome condensation 1/beta-lactamase-inhibitor protein II [Zychaea mexicana]
MTTTSLTRSLFSFGFNAFSQTAPTSDDESIDSHKHIAVDKVLLPTWETTIIAKDGDRLEIWGWTPENQDNELKLWDNRAIKRIFGPMGHGWVGVIDQGGSVWHYYFGSKDGAGASKKLLTTSAKDADYCESHDAIYVLTENGYVDCYQKQKEDSTTFSTASRLTHLPQIQAMAVSFSHILFYTTEGFNPIYALGSNRYSQLGFDTTIQGEDDACVPIDFFSGIIAQSASIACSPFHSAVVLDGELYTFGWRKGGRLGWGSGSKDNDGHGGGDDNDDDVIRLADFRDDNNETAEVHVVKVVCGANHTMALDDHGRIWTCGSIQTTRSNYIY